MSQTEIQEIVDRETRSWNEQSVDLLLSVFHPDMVWVWPTDPKNHDPISWLSMLGKFDQTRWANVYSESSPSLNPEDPTQEVTSKIFTYDTYVGTYLWGGMPTASSGQILQTAVDHLKSKGFTTFRMLADLDQTQSEYGLQSYSTANPPVVLSDLLLDAEYLSVIQDNQLKVLTLTTYDSKSKLGSPVINMLNLDWLISHEADVVKEYTDFFVKILEKTSDQEKIFIISSWESDNQVYAGSAYSLAQDPALLASWTSKFSGGLDQIFNSFNKWQSIRKEAVRQANLVAQKRSYKSKILFAIEFNSLRMLKEAGLPSVLEKTVPILKPDFVLYSSYESLNREIDIAPGSFAIDLKQIRNFLTLNGLTETKIGVGEYGVDRAMSAATRKTWLSAFNSTITDKNSEVSLAYLWASFNRSEADLNGWDAWGLYKKDLTPHLAPSNTKLVPGAFGVNSLANSSGHFLEVYGDFNMSATVSNSTIGQLKCQGIFVGVDAIFRSASQVNFKLSDTEYWFALGKIRTAHGRQGAQRLGF